MTLAERIRSFDFSVPARDVAKQLGCSDAYVRAARNRARNPELYNRLSRESARRKYAKRPEHYRERWRKYYQENKERISERERMKRIETKGSHAVGVLL